MFIYVYTDVYRRTRAKKRFTHVVQNERPYCLLSLLHHQLTEGCRYVLSLAIIMAIVPPRAELKSSGIAGAPHFPRGGAGLMS